mmetsp:Transcript_2636/g.10072  ORF Transcript_2636/g.10072 Transcript_2636/m.10072 type:complete len:89 (+) Transcript_2636:184-450(+)
MTKYIQDKTKRFCSFTKRKRGLEKLVEKFHKDTGDEMFVVIQSQHGNIFCISTNGFHSFSRIICEKMKEKRSLGSKMRFGKNQDESSG